MKRVLDDVTMQTLDSMTTEQLGMPSLVLMERASLAVAQKLEHHGLINRRILCVCGMGGNGGDGICVARILALKGYQAEILLMFDEIVENSGKMHPSTITQLRIARSCGVKEMRWTGKKTDFSAYDVIVDAMFGVGLRREITGEFARCICAVNAAKEQKKERLYVVSVDIPSGVHAGTGNVLGVAVRADETVTFSYEKVGHLLYPGCEYAGKRCVADVGFPEFLTQKIIRETGCGMYCMEDTDLSLLPKRPAYSNKGTFGKVLIIAGSEKMTGAAFFAAKAAYMSGAGLVKLMSAQGCVDCVRTMLPEALTEVLCDENTLESQMENALVWADSVVIGPGIGTDRTAHKILHITLELQQKLAKPMVVDADAINMLAEEGDFRKLLTKNTVLTPHLKELSRLIGKPVEEIAGSLIDTARQCTYNNNLVYVIKDARTLTACEDKIFINTTGCNGMATGGSGDVLAGFIGGLMATTEPVTAAALGVFLHGRAGERAARSKGVHAMLAEDILNALMI